MVSTFFIFSYLSHNPLFFQTPYYQALSGIIGSKFAVLLLYCWSKMVNFSCPKCLQTRINAGFYLSNDFIVGNTIKVKALLGIIPYLSLLQLFALMHYHALLGTIISKFVAILLQKLFFVT